MQTDHQAAGLRRLFRQGSAPLVISVMSPAGAQEYYGITARLAQEFSQQGQRVLQVETRPSSKACHPLFQWNPERHLEQQMVENNGHLLLWAFGCKGGDRAIVSAAAGLPGEIDLVVFGEVTYSFQEAALDMATAQSVVLLVDEDHLEVAYAHLKGLHELHSIRDCVAAGSGANRLAQASQRFLKLPFSPAEDSEDVWHIRHDSPQTSSNTLSGCPDLRRYVARILRRRSQEAYKITSYAS